MAGVANSVTINTRQILEKTYSIMTDIPMHLVIVKQRCKFTLTHDLQQQYQ